MVPAEKFNKQRVNKLFFLMSQSKNKQKTEIKLEITILVSQMIIPTLF